MNIKYSKISIAFILLLGITIYIYITTKAYLSSFTIDESFSYLTYVHTSFMDIISFRDWYSNNHILNSLFMKYSEKLFGNSELSLRLPNLLLLSVYMTYSYLLFRRENPLIQVGIFILLCTNNAFIDFFGLARGYGLSFGFMLMSLYHFIQIFNEQKSKHIILFHVGALLATLSSFGLFNVYLILLLIYNVIIFIDSSLSSQKTYNFFSSNRAHFIPVLINAIILYEPIRRVSLNTDLDFGGKTGLYTDTITGLINYYLNDLPLSPVELIIAKIIFTIILLIPFSIIMLKLIKRDHNFFQDFKGLIITNFLIILLFIAIVFQHILLKVDYPITRFSLFLLPIFIIHLGFFLSYISGFYKKAVYIVILILPLISGARFLSKVNLYSCAEWSFEMETKNMIQKLAEYHNGNSSDPNKIKVGIDWKFEPTINFYRKTKNLNWLLPVDRKGITASDDYYYIFKDELNQLSPESYKLIHEFEKTNTVLLKNLKVVNIK